MMLGYRTSQSSHLKISTTFIKHNINAPFENHFESGGCRVKQPNSEILPMDFTFIDSEFGRACQ